MRSGIIGAGNWIVDRVKMIDRWPKEGELCNITREQACGGGGPCNVLFDISAMKAGIPLYACGVLGDDTEGGFLQQQIKKHAIDNRYMNTDKNERTSYTDVMTVESNGKRTFFHNRGANKTLSPEHITGIDVPAKIFYLGYLLLLDELDAKDDEYGTKAARTLAEMRKKGYEVIVDIVSEDPRKFKAIVEPALKHIDYLVINEVEAGCCLGSKVRDEKGKIIESNLRECLNFLSHSGVQKTVVIHFPEGVLALEKDGTYHRLGSCYIPPKNIVGSVGAGDAFCAGFLYGVHQNLPLTQTLNIASASAWFNLHHETSSGGAPTIDAILKHIDTCVFNSAEDI